MYIYIQLNIYIYIYIYIYLWCIFIYIFIKMYVYIVYISCVYVYIYTYIYIYLHTYTYIHFRRVFLSTLGSTFFKFIKIKLLPVLRKKQDSPHYDARFLYIHLQTDYFRIKKIVFNENIETVIFSSFFVFFQHILKVIIPFCYFGQLCYCKVQ